MVKVVTTIVGFERDI